MKSLHRAGMMCGMLGLAAALWAAPALPGYSGNAAFPTAETAAAGSLQAAVAFDNNSAYYMYAAKPDYPIRLLYGASARSEVGATFNPTVIGEDDANIWSLHAKHRFTASPLGFAVAAGARYARSHSRIPLPPPPYGPGGKLSGNESTLIGYIAGTRALALPEGAPAVNATLGLHYNWQDTDFNLPGTPSTRQSLRAFLGLDATFANGLRLSAEVQSKKEEEDEKAVYAFAARCPVAGNAMAEIGYTNLDPTGILGLSDGKIFAGVTLRLSGGTAE